MKNLSITFIFLIITVQVAFCCTFVPDSFCKTAAEFSDNIIVSGYITAVDGDGINFEIIQLIRGDESRSNIRIWDGTDFDCNGPFSMAAADFGQVNDSLILILPKIDSLENTWDQIGDYRRPDNYVKSPLLIVQNNEVRGFISGEIFAPPESILYSFKYDSFVDSWLENNDCARITNTVEPTSHNVLAIYPNPAEDAIFIGSTTAGSRVDIAVYNQQGIEVIAKQQVQTETPVSIASLSAGMYYLRIENEEGIISTKRLVKI